MDHQRANRWLCICLAACGTGAGASACSKPATALVVAMGAEDDTLRAVDQVRIEVVRGDAPKFSNDYQIDPSGRPLPGTLTLVDDGDDGAVRVDLIGTSKGIERVRRRAILGFVPERVKVLRLVLDAECLGVVCSDISTTCDRGACVSANVDSSELSDFTTQDAAIATISRGSGGQGGKGGAGGSAGSGGVGGAAGKGGVGGAGAAAAAGSSGKAGSAGSAGAGGGGAGNAGTAGVGGVGGGGASGSSGAGGAAALTGLVHCWVAEAKGADGGGTNDATVHADVAYAMDGGARSFQCGTTAGPGTGIDAGQNPNLGVTSPWSVELWVKPLASVTDVWLVDRTGSSLSLASLSIDVGGTWNWAVRFSDQPASPTLLAMPTPANNVWTHLMLTWSGSAFVGYSNGANIGTLAKAQVPGGGQFSFNPPRWCGHPVSGKGFGGRIDAMRMWSRALTPAEVATIAAGGKRTCVLPLLRRRSAPATAAPRCARPVSCIHVAGVESASST